MVMTTPAVEDYVKAIFALAAMGRPATTGTLAARLGVAPPSVTTMIKRLARHGLVRHAPYRVTTLTEAGRTLALAVLRRHRLIELVLIRSLGIPPRAAHDEAERLEHALSPRLVERLEVLLGHPLDLPPARGRRAC